MTKFVAVAPVAELADGKGKAVSIGEKNIAVFRVGREYFAISNECPHYGAELCDGSVRGATVRCPWHGWQFDLRSGLGLTVEGCDVEAFAVKVEDGTVKIEI